MEIYIPAASAALTANGTSAGVVTVTSVTPFYEGAIAWLGATGVTSLQVKIITINTSTNTMTVRAWTTEKPVQSNYPQPGWDNTLPVPDNSQLMYGGTTGITAFTTAASARIEMPAQAIAVNPANTQLQPN